MWPQKSAIVHLHQNSHSLGLRVRHCYLFSLYFTIDKKIMLFAFIMCFEIKLAVLTGFEWIKHRMDFASLYGGSLKNSHFRRRKRSVWKKKKVPLKSFLAPILPEDKSKPRLTKKTFRCSIPKIGEDRGYFWIENFAWELSGLFHNEEIYKQKYLNLMFLSIRKSKTAWVLFLTGASVLSFPSFAQSYAYLTEQDKIRINTLGESPYRKELIGEYVSQLRSRTKAAGVKTEENLPPMPNGLDDRKGIVSNDCLKCSFFLTNAKKRKIGETALLPPSKDSALFYLNSR